MDHGPPQRHDSGGGAGESAGLTKMAATMERFVAVVKQYPGQRTGPSLLQRRRWRRMEMRIKMEETRRSITVLFVTLNKKTHTVSAHCALSIEHSECTQHSVHNTSLALKCTEHSVLLNPKGTQHSVPLTF